MEVSKLHERLIKLKEQAIPGMEDLELADFEFGPSCEYLSEFKKTGAGIELVFGEEKEITLTEAIDIVGNIVKTNPEKRVFRRYQGYEYPLKRIYEDVPVIIMECEIPFDDEEE